jgi:hypothetical protein
MSLMAEHQVGSVSRARRPTIIILACATKKITSLATSRRTILKQVTMRGLHQLEAVRLRKTVGFEFGDSQRSFGEG